MEVDVVVVGGGIAGMSVAAELSSDAGLRIAVIERESQLAYHSTGRSAAAFLESYGSPEIRALTRASRPLFDIPAPAGDIPDGDIPDGDAVGTAAPDSDMVAPALLTRRRMLWVASAPHISELTRMADGEPSLRLVDDAEARELCPALGPDWVRVGAVEDGACDIDVAGLFERYRRLALGNQVAIRPGHGLRGVRRSGRSWQLETDGDEFRADIVVNAAGAWADQVATLCGAEPIGLTPLRRTVAVVTCAAARREWPLVCDVAEGFYFRPEGTGLLVSPADETPLSPCDARPADEDVAMAIDRVNEATTLNLRHVRTAWAGLRTFAADRNPVVGFDTGCPGLFWLAGQGGYGMQTAPAMATLAAALIRGESMPASLAAHGLDLAKLSPARGARM